MNGSKNSNLNELSISRSSSPSYFNNIDRSLQSSDRFHHKLNDLYNNFFSRHFSVNSKTLPSSSFNDSNNFLRWRGANLLSDDLFENNDEDISSIGNCNDSFITQDEQDSGFGESTLLSIKDTLILEEKNYIDSFSSFDLEGTVLNIELDRGWHSRLGFSLTECILSKNQFKACKVRTIFPNSVAAKDGRIKVGDILLYVNNEPLINRPAKEVISDLRKIKGKLNLIFVRNVHSSNT